MLLIKISLTLGAHLSLFVICSSCFFSLTLSAAPPGKMFLTTAPEFLEPEMPKPKPLPSLFRMITWTWAHSHWSWNKNNNFCPNLSTRPVSRFDKKIINILNDIQEKISRELLKAHGFCFHRDLFRIFPCHHARDFQKKCRSSKNVLVSPNPGWMHFPFLPSNPRLQSKYAKQPKLISPPRI